MNSLLQTGLPANLDAERMVLGSLLVDSESHGDMIALVEPSDFTTEKHRRIFLSMRELAGVSTPIDRVTIYNRLRETNRVEGDSLSYLGSLDDGLPKLPSIESYVSIIKNAAALRRLITTAQSVLNRALLPGEQSQDLIAWAVAQLEGAVRETDTKSPLLGAAEIIDQAGGMNSFMGSVKLAGGILTGWVKLDEMTTGLHPGELVMIAGNPSMGKTALAMQLASWVAAKQDKGVAVFSLEMSGATLLQRMICQWARVDNHKVRSGFTSKDERLKLAVAAEDVRNIPLWIADHKCTTVPAMKAAIKRQRGKQRIDMAVIDYLQLMRAVGRYGNRDTEIGEITRSLKVFAMEEKLVVVLLSQLNRENIREKRAPMLSDLRESGNIEQDADVVLFVWRPELIHRDREDLKGRAELLLSKQRNGPIGKINLVWLGHLTKFENSANDCGMEEM